METESSRVRQNYLAILVAAIACFIFEATWYSFFLNTWLQGIGRSQQWLHSSGMNLGVQCAVAMIAEAVIATAISCVTQLTGPQTMLRGIKAAAMLWLGFIATSLAVGYVFEVRPIQSYAVDAGFWLIGFVLMGAIVGSWKKKS